MAVIESLRYLDEKKAPTDDIHVFLDSKYVQE